MKKLITILMAAAMLLSVCALTGCGQTEEATKEVAETETAETAETAELYTAEEGVLTMGTNAAFPPYEFYDGEDIVGIDAEIAAAIAEKLGMELNIQDMDFSTLISAVQAGKIDVSLAGMTVTEERLENVDFSTSYATGIQSIIVPEGSDITCPDDLTAKLEAGEEFFIGTQDATTGFIYATSDFGDDHVLSYANGATAVQALMDGKVDCVIIDNQPAIQFVNTNEGLVILDTEYVTEDYAIAISKDNPGLTAAINEALAELTEDGTIQAILDKYISSGDEAADTDAAADAEAEAAAEEAAAE